MNDTSLDRLIMYFSEFEEQYEVNGFSDLDLRRLRRLRDKINKIIKEMEREMEKD